MIEDNLLMVIVWIGYLLILLPLYTFKEKQNGHVKALQYKLALSGVFCMIGICSLLRHFDLFTTLMFLGYLFSFLGDYYLIFINENEHKFIKGIVSFGITHVFYSLAMILLVGLGIKEFIITAILLALLMIGKSIKKIDMGRAQIPLCIYSGFLIFMASKAFIMLISGQEPLLMQEMFSIGAILFLISDAFLGLWRYILPKGIFTYFIAISYFWGQLMIATAVFYQN